MHHPTKLAAVVLFVLSARLFSQSIPMFEVVSVRAVPQDSRTWAIRQVNPARYRSLSNVMQLITWAWKVKNYQVLAAPAWTSQERFEIQATTTHPSSVEDERLMLQRVLTDRFRLKAHKETREIPVYALIVGTNALKLTAAKEGAAPAGTRGINIASGVLTAREGTMNDFADVLTTNLDRPVIDRTNLVGRYDFTLTWDQNTPAGPVWRPIGPALFTPIRELGLRLNPERAPIEMLVIDSVEHPAGN